MQTCYQRAAPLTIDHSGEGTPYFDYTIAKSEGGRGVDSFVSRTQKTIQERLTLSKGKDKRKKMKPWIRHILLKKINMKK